MKDLRVVCFLFVSLLQKALILRNMSEDEYRREELIREIERRVEQMTLRQLEALQYELETKDYSADDAG